MSDERPWESEPDAEDFTTDGYPCAVRRAGEMKHLCGYVGVPKDSPLAGLNYDDLPVDAHGGLTYGAEGDGEYLPAGYFWFGFDCAHSGDLSPFSAEKYPDSVRSDAVYRTFDWVRRQTTWLASEIAKLDRLVRWAKAQGAAEAFEQRREEVASDE